MGYMQPICSPCSPNKKGSLTCEPSWILVPETRITKAKILLDRQ